MQLCMAQLIPAPRLNCVENSAGNSILTWTTVPANPCGAFVGYLIYESPAIGGPYTLDTIFTDPNATSWTDIGAANNTSFYYVRDSFNCPAATYLTSDTIQNESNPKTPVIEGVDVLPDGHVQFIWDPSTSPQTRYYVIYLITANGQHLAIDTVYGRFNTSWIDSIHDPTATSLQYTVDARDSCLLNQPSAFNTSPQQSIFAQYQTAHCDKAIKLTWSQYSNLPGGVHSYEVFVSKGGGPYTEVASVDSLTFNYDFPDFADGDSLQIYIVAVSATDTNHVLHSNYMRFTANVIKPPSYIYITNITVDQTNNIDVTWLVDNKAKIRSFEVRNSEDNASYLIVNIQNVAPPVPANGYYADSAVQPQYEPYYYDVTAFDSCSGSIVAPYAESISLTATLSDYYEISLNWNPLHIFNARVLRQNLYRDLGNGTGYQLIKTFNDSTTVFYIDSVYQYLNEKGSFCYRIEAIYHISLPLANFDSIMSSYSNIACVDHRPIIYIPNALVFNGTNNFFKPRIIFGDPVGYTMQIYNRYGGRIFETHDVNEGWYGTDGGKPVQQGGYTYLIEFTASDGTKIERTGIVMLLRK
ncbi:MAG: hypothetical protein JWO03_3666 [Bacteroidetes bacterium]|nr:hypothetical protein [Bacteroidota bacterium]